MLHPTPHSLYGLVLAGMLLVGGPQPTMAQSRATLRHFEVGNRHYEQGRYERAIEAYQSALDTGHSSGALHYNLGNAYFRAGQLGYAILHYEKARRLRPEHPELLHSLEVAQSRAGGASFSGRRGWRALAGAVDSARTFILGLALYVIGLALMAYRWWIRGEALLRTSSRALLAVGLLLIVTALGASYVRALDHRVVVISKNAPLHVSPSDRAPRDTTLQEGTVLDLRRRQHTWTEVRLPNGHTGWLRTEALAEV